MINLQNPSSHKLVNKIAVFNLALLAIDWVLVYISSRQVEAIYQKVGIDALYNVGAYYFKLRSSIIVIGSLVAVFKFWEVKNRKLSFSDKWILKIAFFVLIVGTIAVIETFLETIIRLI